MKHFFFTLLLPALVLAGCSNDDDGDNTPINPLTKIVDPGFREYCERFDLNDDGVLSRGEILKVTEMDLYYDRVMNIASLAGIEYFTELTYLDCQINYLRTLDLSKNTKLTYLKCSYGHLKTLDLSKNTELTYLDCSYNRLEGLNISNCTKLHALYCYYHPDLTEIIVWDSFDIANPNNSIAAITKDGWATFVKK